MLGRVGPVLWRIGRVLGAPVSKGMAQAVRSCEDNARTLVFSYGSNSMAQLRARIQARQVESTPAAVHGWVRIFCMYSSNWGGGVASLHPHTSGMVRGAIVSLDAEQLARLDEFERGYTKTPLTATIEDPGNSSRTEEVIAYIANDSSWTAAPSESYLTAINLMLREHWDTADEPLSVLGAAGDEVEEMGPAWRHPGVKSLGLRALCVEINARLLKRPLVVPRATAEFEKALSQIGITSTPKLSAALSEGVASPALRQALAACGGDEDEILQVCREVLGVRLVFVYGSLMTGFNNHHYLAGSTRLMSDASTELHFTMAASSAEHREYPYALDQEDSRPSDTLCALKGEVYVVDDALLSTLDWLEDHPNLYTRRLTRIANLSEPAWMYVLSSRDSIDCVRALTWEHPQVLPLGDWRAFKAAEPQK